MNKTITTNIGGFIFHIDDNAYEKLSQYLNTIKGYFKNSEGRDEIIGDIEERIAEMFREKTGNVRQVITLKDVDEVIAVMGQPEAFAESGDASANTTDSTSSASGEYSSRKKTRRIFRDPDEKVLGGVCSGISAYFDIDPIWMRLAFAISFFVFGSGFLLYLILWIIIPKAHTTAEKLEMRGESVNIHNIEKTIREEMDELKQRLHDLSGEAKDLGRKDGKFRNGVHDIVDFIGSFFRLIFKAIGKVIGAFLLIIGIILLVAIIASLAGLPGVIHISDHGIQTSLSLNELMINFAGSSELIWWAIAGLALVLCVPLLGMVFGGVKILFGIKYRNRFINWIGGLLWTAGVIICIIVSVQIFKDFKITSSQKSTVNITKPSTSGVLYLEALNNNKDIEEESEEVGDWMFYTDGEEVKLFRKPELDIEKSESDSIELIVTRYSKGSTRKEAIGRAERVNYKFSQNDSVLVFDKYMSLNKDDKWRFQDVKMTLKLPVGQTIFLDEEMKNIIFDISNVTNTWDNDMVNRRWMMTENGLSCVDCDNLKNIGSDEDNEWDSEAPEPPSPPVPPVKNKKQKLKNEAAISDTGITREQYDYLSKLNKMYHELKDTESNLVL